MAHDLKPIYVFKNHSDDLFRSQFDEYGGVMTVDWGHAMSHAGKAFVFGEELDLGLNGTHDYLIQVPTGVHLHLNMATIMSSTGESHFEMFEHTTFSSAGTGITVFNRNRSKPDNTGLLSHTPTITADGDSFYGPIHFGTGKNTGGQSTDRNEFEFDESNNYLLRVTSEAAGNLIRMMFDGYLLED